MMEKLIWIRPESRPDFSEVNEAISEGWKTKIVAPQSCSSSGYSEYGGFIFVMEKDELDI